MTVFLYVMPLTGTAYSSGEVTPSDVFVLTEKFKRHLLDLSVITPAGINSALKESSLRHPRHVIQKVRECHILLSKHLIRRGISPTPFPEYNFLREIRPSDVKTGVQHLLDEMRKIGGVEDKAITLTSEKLPIDVFNNLKKTCNAIDVEISPSDIYQAAVGVLVNVRQIGKVRGISIPLQIDQVSVSKSSQDVYDLAIRLLNHLRELSLYADFAIPGGVVIGESRADKSVGERIILAALNDAFSETSAISYSLHIQDRITLPTYAENKTLTDVYKKIYLADLIVQKLLDDEAKKQKELGLR